MKTIFRALTFAAFLFVAAGTKAQSQGSDQSLIGIARGAAHECLQPYEGQYDINASVQTTGICFVSGELHRVTFTASPKCHGNGPCPFFAILAATVDFDCNNNVVAVNCTAQ